MKTQVTTEPASSSDPMMGMYAGPWRIEYELGRGGMGVVYAVEHVQIGKRAALKVLHRRIPDPDQHAQRMVLEARVVNAIGHPNIVDVFDVGTTFDGRPYIVMERLEGAPLAELHVDRRRAIEILLEVCNALAAAHRAGVVHRDLKPDNIFVGERQVTLLDWGIARLLHADVHATGEGQLVGTPQYIAPEQARGDEVSPATDVYSLGVVAYELFTGDAPFEAKSAAQVMAMHLFAAPRPPHLIAPAIPPALEALVLEMLAKDPAERPTIREVAARLTECLDDAPLAVPEDDPPIEIRTRRRWPMLAGAAAIASSAAVFTMRDPDKITLTPTGSVAVAASPPTAITGPECADPSVLHDGGRYFMTCTAREGGNLFPIYQSTNLKDWHRTGFIFPAGARPAWARGNYWAPELHREGNRIAAYFSMREMGGKNAIGVATAGSPAGPFTDRGEPLIAPKRGASDAHAFIDEDGTHYIYFKREGEPSKIAVSVGGETTDVLTPAFAWQHDNVEAPWLTKHDGYYYLFFSGSRYCETTYAIGVARAKSPRGPFEQLPTPLVTTNDRWISPGHASVVDDRLVFHAYRNAPKCDGPSGKRFAQLAPMEFVDGWPRIAH